MESISTIKPTITENTECSIVKACVTFIDLMIGLLLDHEASPMNCFASSSTNMSGNIPGRG